MGLKAAITGFGQLLAAEPIAELRETNRQYADSLELFQERLAELELALEDGGWRQLSGDSDREFSREALRTINRLARIFWLKNPLVRQGVAVQTRYVFGQGLGIQAHDPEVNAVVQKFLDDHKNKAELTSHQARMTKETELQLFSNIFFVFFVNRSTGRVRVRTINPDEIDEVIANPEDAKDPWYYKRVWQAKRWDPTSGRTLIVHETAYYPDWRHKPEGGHPGSIGGHPVRQDEPVYHVSVNRLSDMTFGVSEIYSALDWAKAYTQFLSDWATIVKAYSRFAWNLTTKGGQAGVAAAKGRLASTVSVANVREANPPPAAASTFVASEGVKLEPVKTAGATTKAEDGRHLKLMVSAALGIFEHYLGDPSTGNLATSQSMERPMELQFVDRQQLWKDVHLAILDFVVYWSAKAPNGRLAKLGARIEIDEDGDEVVVMPSDDDGNERDRHIDVDFPPLLQKNTKDTVQAIISAATLDGKQLQTMTPRVATKMLLVALGEDDVDEMLDHLFGEDGEGGTLGQVETPEADEQVTEAVRKLAEAAQRMAGAPDAT